MSNIVQGLLSAFGGSVNLTAILALLGGYTGIVMIFMSPLMAFVLRASWSTRKKNAFVWAACFVATGIGLYIVHGFTGSLWDVGTWTATWGLMSVGAGVYHDKIWGTDGTGISTFIEKNYFPGTHVPVPVTVEQLKDSALKILKELGISMLKDGATTALGKLAESKSNVSAVYTGAGTAGAFPNPDTAPLYGGSTVDTTVAVDPTKMAAQAILNAINGHATTGQSAVPEGATLPVVPLSVPHMTPAPADQETISRINEAIAAGESVEDVVGNVHEEEAVAPGGSE